jgi:hypothetical protein
MFVEGLNTTYSSERKRCFNRRTLVVQALETGSKARGDACAHSRKASLEHAPRGQQARHDLEVETVHSDQKA